MSPISVTDDALEQMLAPLVPGGIQWFPGHMAKAQREITERLKLVNVVIEVVDARVPASSRNPYLVDLWRGKRHILALTKTDLADPAATRQWQRHLRREVEFVFPVDAAKGTGMRALESAVRQAGLPARVLVAGVPNAGKSSLINRVCRRSGAKVGANPGVTRGPQWLKAGPGVEFLDTPGLLWPKITTLLQALKLAWVSSIGENAYDPIGVGGALAVWLAVCHPNVLQERYGIAAEDLEPQAENLLTAIGCRRGCLAPGGGINQEQAARLLLADFRSGKLGRLTLDNAPA